MHDDQRLPPGSDFKDEPWQSDTPGARTARRKSVQRGGSAIAVRAVGDRGGGTQGAQAAGRSNHDKPCHDPEPPAPEPVVAHERIITVDTRGRQLMMDRAAEALRGERCSPRRP